MIQEIPLPLEFHYTVMCGPSDYRFQNNTLKGEGAVWIVANGIAKQVAVAGRIGEVVLTLVFMHPTGLKEAVWVVSF